MTRRKVTAMHLVGFFSLATLATAPLSVTPAQAADKDKGKTQTLDGATTEAERVSIENIKEKYWARGDESELGVVQNRMYTKARKFELGLYGGVVSTDPFLTVYSVSGTLGYHFNEYVSLNLFGMKNFVTPSSALEFLRNPYPAGAGSDTSTNEPKWYLGSEVMASILYGKLSLVGKAIIHYDFHFIGGLGATSTESGTYVSPTVGVGQQFFLTKYLTLRADYRLTIYRETILQKVGSPSSPVGTPLGDRTNFSNSISVGISFLVDPFGKKAPAQETNPASAAGSK